MSAEKPEVGDVWKFAHGIYYLVLWCEKGSLIVLRSDNLRTFQVLTCQLGEYIGKSKANINDLFEVKNEL